WLDSLGKVTFHNKLGTVADQIDRIAALSREIAPVVGADPDQAEKAARLAKADLASEMVYEFPELQGIMGRYYIERAGEAPEIAAVAEDHYAPLGPSDDVPTAPVSVAVALAEKIDKLALFWWINEKPTGSKDPFALRRAALGVIRLIIESQLDEYLRELFAHHLVTSLGLRQRLETAASEIKMSNSDFGELGSVFAEIREAGLDRSSAPLTFKKLLSDWSRHEDLSSGNMGALRQLEKEIEEIEPKAQDLLSFFHDRLKVYLRDQGIRHDVIDACLAMPGNDDLTLLVKRANALSDFLKTDDGENLLQGFKRANNILSQAEEKDGVEYSFGADIKFAETDEECALFKALDDADAHITPAMNDEDFAKAMTAMAALRAPIDAFFEAVQVNADSATIRRNRLNLLHRIRTICLSVADLTRVEG
ncbi:MAG: glycine--tRNA ligase subunit beta, partial [Pseudomonadota bacterium]